jgi:hypothetical protein
MGSSLLTSPPSFLDGPASEAPEVVGTSSERDGEPVDWTALIPLIIHPVKIWIVESLRVYGHPLSPSEFEQIFDGAAYVKDKKEKRVSLSNLAYHVNELVKLGVIHRVHERPVRGAEESFYYLTARKVPKGWKPTPPKSRRRGFV